MTETSHLVVESGTDVGRKIAVPPAGARLGRSSKNDIVLLDPVLSRHHCRLFFKPPDGLWIADLGSSNQTLVNDQPVREHKLEINDRITLGDTIARVTDNGMPSAPGAAPVPVPAKGAGVDLGFGSPVHAPRKKLSMGPLIIIALIVAAAATLIWAPKLMRPKAKPPAPAPTHVTAPVPDSIEIEYEKVEATPDNAFRYYLQVLPNGTLSVQIDDVANNRHVRKEKEMDPTYLEDLTELISDSGFFELEPEYRGIQPDIMDLWDLSITIGRRTHRTKVVNREEPEVFRRVREQIEESGKNELGLWAIQFSPEKLVEMARDATVLAKKLYDERQIRYGNLASALRTYHEAEWYLETVAPKPDFYPQILSGVTDCKRELDQHYEERNFRALRAIRNGNWQEASTELRILAEMIPDRADSRNKDIRKKLLDVQNRLGAEKR